MGVAARMGLPLRSHSGARPNTRETPTDLQQDIVFWTPIVKQLGLKID